MELKFKTNINCGGCKAKVTPFLNEEKEISNWQVDLDSPDRILTIKSDTVSPEKVVEAVGKAGFTAERV